MLNYLFTLWSRVLLEELKSYQLVKQFPAFYSTQMFITALTSAHHLSLILSLLDPVHTSTFHFLKIHANIILPSMPGSLSFRFPNQYPAYAPSLPHTCYKPCPSHSSRFYHPNNNGWGVQIIKLLIMYFIVILKPCNLNLLYVYIPTKLHLNLLN